MSLPAHVLVTINLQLGEVPVVFADLLRPALEYETVTFQPRRGGKLNHSRCRMALCERVGDVFQFPAGCVPRVRRLLDSRGIRVELRDLRRWDCDALRVDEAGLRSIAPPPIGFLSALRDSPTGVIEAARGHTRSTRVGEMCRYLPRAMTFVACATIERVHEVAAALGKYVGDAVTAVRHRNWRAGTRVVVGTLTSFDMSDAADWNMLIFEDAVEAVGRKTHETLPLYRNHRIYAFVEPGIMLSHRDQLLTEALAGPVIYRADERARQERRVEVVFASVPTPARRSVTDRRERKRQLWGASHRNACIAAIAQACADQRAEELWRRGLFIEAENPFERWDGSPGVAVVVETVEHGRKLAELMPHWTLLDALPSDPTAARVPSWADFSIPNRSIVTIGRANRYRDFTPDIVIIASGGSFPQLPCGLAEPGHDVLIVDVLDDANELLERDTEQRAAAYRELGYVVHVPGCGRRS